MAPSLARCPRKRQVDSKIQEETRRSGKQTAEGEAGDERSTAPLPVACRRSCGRSGSIPNQVTPSSWWSGRGRAHTSILVVIIFGEPSPFFLPLSFSFRQGNTVRCGVYKRGACTWEREDGSSIHDSCMKERPTS